MANGQWPMAGLGPGGDLGGLRGVQVSPNTVKHIKLEPNGILKRIFRLQAEVVASNEATWTSPGGSMLSSTAPAHQMKPNGILQRIFRNPAEVVAGPAARSPRSTRAGGQDDGS